MAFVFLWFKENFLPLKKINVSFLIPLSLFLAISLIRVLFIFRSRKFIIPFALNKNITAIFVLVLIALVVRVPFLVYNFGLLDADDGLSVLTAKHISEGKIPPVYHYGQFYLGTSCYHIYALIFSLFGFSILSPLLVSVFFYLIFVILQFLFFKNIFSSSIMSFVAALFYCLPIGHLLAVSFHLGISFPLVLSISSFSMYLTYLICERKKAKLIPYLGFSLGFLYWLHPVTITFSLTSLILLILRFEWNLKKFVNLAFFAAVGGFPIIISEIFYKFMAIKHILSGKETRDISVDKIKSVWSHLISLVSSESNFFNSLYIIFFLLGILAILYINYKKKRFIPHNFFLIFFFVFTVIFLFSKFSHNQYFHMRYFYPLYFVFPVFLVAVFDLVKLKFNFVFALLFFLIIVLFSNMNVTYKNYQSVKKAHFHLKKIIKAVEKTEKKYWAGEYWQVNLLTALSGEKIIGWAYSHEDYLPYKLMYFNEGENNNFVFFYEPGSFAVKFKEKYAHISSVSERNFKQSNQMISLLNRLDIKAEKERVGEHCWLIHGMPGSVFPSAVTAPIPRIIPDLSVSEMTCSNGELTVIFNNRPTSEKCRFRMHMEIPDYSTAVRGFSSDDEKIAFRIPFPLKKSFTIRYYLDYCGLIIPSSEKETVYCPSDQDLGAARKRILLLSGIGPWKRMHGKERRTSDKEVTFEINKSLRRNSKICLYLYSPFFFSNPFWYDGYSQSVRIEMNGNYLTERQLKDGENIVEVDLSKAEVKEDRNFVKLMFKYHMSFKSISMRKTAAMLEKIEIR